VKSLFAPDYAELNICRVLRTNKLRHLRCTVPGAEVYPPWQDAERRHVNSSAPAATTAEAERMQLKVARVCLDCEEIHDSQQCPVCASETFAYADSDPRPCPGADPGAASTSAVVHGGLGRAIRKFGVYGRWCL